MRCSALLFLAAAVPALAGDYRGRPRPPPAPESDWFFKHTPVEALDAARRPLPDAFTWASVRGRSMVREREGWRAASDGGAAA